MSNFKSSDKPAQPRRLWRWLMLGFLLLPLLYLFTLSPSHEGEWSPLQTRLPLVEIQKSHNGANYHISNLRDFRYNGDGSVREANYIKQSYGLADLQQVWFGISHFGDYGLAHTYLSFEFADEIFLAASVEARLHPAQSYNPFLGLMRQYNKLVVLGTEADIIGLRTTIRRERVLLYPLQLSLAQRNHLFTAVMEDAQAIAQQPAFYNTLFDNCTTNLLKHDPDYRFYNGFLDYRLLLPGYSDAVAYEKAWLDNSLTLEDLRLAATINNGDLTSDPEAFSRAIRQHWLKKQPGIMPGKL